MDAADKSRRLRYAQERNWHLAIDNTKSKTKKLSFLTVLPFIINDKQTCLLSIACCLLNMVREMRKFLFYFRQSILQLLIIVEKSFVIGGSIFGQVPVVRFSHFVVELTVVEFDGLLEVVNVNELNVELIVEVFNLQKDISVCLVPCKVLETVFKLTEFISVRTQCLPPGIAFS